MLGLALQAGCLQLCFQGLLPPPLATLIPLLLLLLPLFPHPSCYLRCLLRSLPLALFPLPLPPALGSTAPALLKIPQAVLQDVRGQGDHMIGVPLRSPPVSPKRVLSEGTPSFKLLQAEGTGR